MDIESQLWRGVVNCTYTGRFIAETVVRGDGPDDCIQQLSQWMDDLDLGSGDWTLSTHRLVARGPEILLARGHWQPQAQRSPALWPVDPPAPRNCRSVPPSQRYR